MATVTPLCAPVFARPTAIQYVPFQAILCTAGGLSVPSPPSKGVVFETHVIPSVDVAIAEPVLRPPTSQYDPFHATVFATEAHDVGLGPGGGSNDAEYCGIHVIPSLEVAIAFVPEPTATQRRPFHATLFTTPPASNGDDCAVQV